MLTQGWWRRADAGLTVGEFEWRVDELDRSALLVIGLDYHVPRDRVRVVQCLLHIVDGGIGQAFPFKHILPPLGRPCLRQGLDVGFELDSVLDAVRIRLEPGLVLPFRPAKAIAKDAEQAIVSASEKDVAVEGLERPIRYNRSCELSDHRQIYQDR